jgi:hypothetical protein
VFLEKENLVSPWKGDDLVAGSAASEREKRPETGTTAGLGRQKGVSGVEFPP